MRDDDEEEEAVYEAAHLFVEAVLTVLSAQAHLVIDQGQTPAQRRTLAGTLACSLLRSGVEGLPLEVMRNTRFFSKEEGGQERVEALIYALIEQVPQEEALAVFLHRPLPIKAKQYEQQEEEEEKEEEKEREYKDEHPMAAVPQVSAADRRAPSPGGTSDRDRGHTRTPRRTAGRTGWRYPRPV